MLTGDVLKNDQLQMLIDEGASKEVPRMSPFTALLFFPSAIVRPALSTWRIAPDRNILRLMSERIEPFSGRICELHCTYRVGSTRFDNVGMKCIAARKGVRIYLQFDVRPVEVVEICDYKLPFGK